MPDRRFWAAVAALLLAVSTPRLLAQTPQQTFVPAAFQHQDAVSYLYAAVGPDPVRMQTMVGPGHLQALAGRELVAVSLRRSAADETFGGATLALQMRLSHSPRTPLSTSRVLAHNLGPAAVLAFDGTVALPTSPPEPGPAVAWAGDNTLRIPLATAPFVYQGGTLCIEILSHEVGGSGTWWVADAAFEDLAGSAVRFGTGCGSIGNGQAWVAERSLIPGAFAQFRAQGTTHGLALMALGVPGTPTSLAQFGMPAACTLYLDPTSAFIAAIDVFEGYDPIWQIPYGTAEANLELPAVNQIVGVTLTTQWFDATQLTVSQGVTATIGGTVPTLAMACVESRGGLPTGNVRVDMAYVLRFEHRAPQ